MALAHNNEATELHHAVIADVPVIAALHAATFSRPWGERDIRALLTSIGALSLIASRSAVPVGFLIARAPADAAEVLTIGVDHAHRRLGVARDLLEELHRGLAARRCRSVFLEVDETNAAAVRLYYGLGYARVGLRRKYYKTANGHRTDALVLRKDLRGTHHV